MDLVRFEWSKRINVNCFGDESTFVEVTPCKLQSILTLIVKLIARIKRCSQRERTVLVPGAISSNAVVRSCNECVAIENDYLFAIRGQPHRR